MKVKCVGYKGEEREFTIGKIYEWNGRLFSDSGFEFRTLVEETDISKWGLSDFYEFELVFDWDEFKSGKIAVHCDTEEKANAFLKECEGHGLRWGDGAATRENNWKDYSTETCYCCYKNILAYTRKKYFAENDYTIIEYKIKEEKQLKFKVGDKVRVKENLKGEKYYSVS